jgi:uncharacterized protein
MGVGMIVDKRQLVQKSPRIHLFQAEDSSYMLDLHSNRLFRLNADEYRVMGRWQAGEALDALVRNDPETVESIQTWEQQGLFCCETPRKIAFAADWAEITERIQHQRMRTLIELTEKCNLACAYCTFRGGFVDHPVHAGCTIPKDLLELALLAAVKSGRDLEELSIGFYGGEPLMEFELMRHAVSFMQCAAGGKPVRFSITTNGTLITHEIASFLRNNHFTILLSLDGPQQLHDHYRLMRNGQGSYERATAGLKTLLSVFPPESYRRIGLNMVIPDWSWHPVLMALWNQESWLPKNMRTMVSLVEAPAGFKVLPVPEELRVYARLESWWERLQKSATSENRGVSQPAYHINSIDGRMATLHQRAVFSQPRQAFFPNGCCIPATRKVYVTVDGVYKLCERVHGCPDIGTVQQGVNMEKVKAIVDTYCSEGIEDCRDCFAISTCKICFQQAFKNGEYSHQRKRVACEQQRRTLQNDLDLYVRTLTRYPEKAEEWDQVTIT